MNKHNLHQLENVYPHNTLKLISDKIITTNINDVISFNNYWTFKLFHLSLILQVINWVDYEL